MNEIARRSKASARRVKGIASPAICFGPPAKRIDRQARQALNSHAQRAGFVSDSL
jgi:hypothetical protein